MGLTYSAKQHLVNSTFAIVDAVACCIWAFGVVPKELHSHLEQGVQLLFMSLLTPPHLRILEVRWNIPHRQPLEHAQPTIFCDRSLALMVNDHFVSAAARHDQSQNSMNS